MNTSRKIRHFNIVRFGLILTLVSTCWISAFSQTQTVKKNAIEDRIYSLEGTVFPDFQLRDLQNKRISRKLLTDKIVVFNFWFIGCAPCVKEIPDLNSIVDHFSGREDIIFIAIALDDPDRLTQFLSRHRFNYRILHSGKEFLTKGLKIESYPVHLILDKKNVVSFVKTGEIKNTKEFINAIENIVR